MIRLDEFLPLVQTAIPRFAHNAPNPHQQACILNPTTEPLMIVAGPGSGKTTVLVLRALRLVFVDQILPEHIVLTTFTRKAAKELRSRLIDWGLLLCERLRTNPPTGRQGFASWLSSIVIGANFRAEGESEPTTCDSSFGWRGAFLIRLIGFRMTT